MIKIVEAFAGIGSQHKALTQLENEIGLEFEIMNTIEWDINAIFSYDIIHNGKQDLTKYKKIQRTQLLERLSKLDISLDGTQPMSLAQLNRFTDDALRSLICAIDRNNNLISIKKVKANDFKENIDIFTYSFPCQDLSMSGYFHGDKGGIARDAGNSSSMLWEVERILLDFDRQGKELPKFLLMENVSSIESKKHIVNFNEWKTQLEELGYTNKVFHLSAEKFGVPQKRKRAFMISAYYGNDEKLKKLFEDRISKSKLDDEDIKYDNDKLKQRLAKSLKLDYKNKIYLEEANDQIPNNTPSRRKILDENPPIIDSKGDLVVDLIRTLTTKQDRNPNSGIIRIDYSVLANQEGKSTFRYLTPRESFILMGFDESDYQNLVSNDIELGIKRNLLTKNKLTKLAGNSIVVDVIKEVFREILDLKNISDKYQEKLLKGDSN